MVLEMIFLDSYFQTSHCLRVWIQFQVVSLDEIDVETRSYLIRFCDKNWEWCDIIKICNDADHTMIFYFFCTKCYKRRGIWMNWMIFMSFLCLISIFMCCSEQNTILNSLTDGSYELWLGKRHDLDPSPNRCSNGLKNIYFELFLFNMSSLIFCYFFIFAFEEKMPRK